MVSNEDRNEKKQAIPLTGIEVMNDLQIDAHKLLYLAKESLLLPCYPKDPMWLALQMNSRLDPPEDTLSRWTYLKPVVDEFKLNYKDLWNELRKQKTSAIDSPDHTNLEANNPLDAVTYIEQRRGEGIHQDIIAAELHDNGFPYKLSYSKIARLLGLGHDLNEGQFDALKQRGRRACEKGRAMTQNSKKQK